MKRDDIEAAITGIVLIGAATLFLLQMDKVRNLEKDLQFIEKQQQAAEKEIREYRQEAQTIINKILKKEW